MVYSYTYVRLSFSIFPWCTIIAWLRCVNVHIRSPQRSDTAILNSNIQSTQCNCRDWWTWPLNEKGMNEWCFRQRFCTVRLHWAEEPGRTRWILLWIMPLVQDRYHSTSYPVVQHATTVPGKCWEKEIANWATTVHKEHTTDGSEKNNTHTFGGLKNLKKKG